MNRILLSLITVFIFQFSFGQSINDNFETNPTVNGWEAIECQIVSNFTNPQKNGINVSNTVLKYNDAGGSYANVRFNTSANFDLSTNNNFSFKIYVSSSEVTGGQTNQVALKLQNSSLNEPWSTQTEIVKAITLDTWQTITFDFESDTYVNLNAGSAAPKDRTDFDRVVIQVNGENNQDKVVAYIDDFEYDGTIGGNQSSVFNTLVWSDEFDGNGAVNSQNWSHQVIPIVNGTDWANNEEQHYTARTDNSYVSNGTLKLVAKKENYTFNGKQKAYTSARLNSKFAFKYGRVEVRAKLPSKAGSWPAIWLLGKNISEVGTYFNEEFGNTPWPFCGEIDIMEPNIAKTEILATWHWDNGSGYIYNSKGIPTNNADTSQNFHNYSLIWDETSMKIYMNNILINELQSFDPFNQEFFILLNVAMGGNLGGTVDANYTEDAMEIDYVRVYQESSLSVEDNLPLEKANLYPNPVDDQLTIKVPARLLGAKVTIYSVLGQKLESFTAAATQFQKNIANYTKGVYFVTFETNSGSEKYSIIKK